MKNSRFKFDFRMQFYFKGKYLNLTNDGAVYLEKSNMADAKLNISLENEIRFTLIIFP